MSISFTQVTGWSNIQTQFWYKQFSADCSSRCVPKRTSEVTVCLWSNYHSFSVSSTFSHCTSSLSSVSASRLSARLSDAPLKVEQLYESQVNPDHIWSRIFFCWNHFSSVQVWLWMKMLMIQKSLHWLLISVKHSLTSIERVCFSCFRFLTKTKKRSICEVWTICLLSKSKKKCQNGLGERDQRRRTGERLRLRRRWFVLACWTFSSSRENNSRLRFNCDAWDCRTI